MPDLEEQQEYNGADEHRPTNPTLLNRFDQVTIHGGPPDQKDNFHIEQDEKHRHNMKFDGEARPVAGRRKSALVGAILDRAVGAARPDENRYKNTGTREQDSGDQHGPSLNKRPVFRTNQHKSPFEQTDRNDSDRFK
jgi:hypothetical protein